MMGSTFSLSPIILQKVREVVAFLPSLFLLYSSIKSPMLYVEADV